jgi:putative inorganic carbon (HCO3(-)) transporter
VTQTSHFRRLLDTSGWPGLGLIARWMVVLVAGTLLGAYAVVATMLPPQYEVLVTLALLTCLFMIIVRNVRRVLLAIILLDIPLQLDINYMYREEPASLGALGGLDISVTTIALVGLYALWLGEFLAEKKPLRWSWFRMALPLVLYIALAGLSMLVAPDGTLAFFEMFLLLQTFLLFLYVVNTTKTREDVLFVVTMLLTGLVLESLIIIGLRFLGHSVRVAGILARVDPGPRVGGTVGSPNNAAAFLVMPLVCALGVLLTQTGRFTKMLAAIALGTGVVALVFTLSRGGWLSFALATGMLCFAAWYRGWLSRKAIIGIVVVLVLLVLVLLPIILGRLTVDDRGSAASRIPLMKLAMRAIWDHPILGIGVNNMPVVIFQYVTPELGDVWVYSAHNKYLLVWAETGPGSLIAFLWFLAATIRRGWQCWRLNDRLLSPLAFSLAVAIIGNMVHMFFDVFRSRPDVELLWVSAALIIAIYRIGQPGIVSGEHATQH